MDRVVDVHVNGFFVRKDNKNAGVQGESNVTTLRITFSSEWEPYSKRIIWRDSNGENAVSLLLYHDVDDLNTGVNPLSFDTLIPSEALAHSGWCSFTVEGYYSAEPGAVAFSAADYLYVAENNSYFKPAEPTPAQALQLQNEIDQIVHQVSDIVQDAVSSIEHTESLLKVWEAWDGGRYVPLEKVSRLGSSYICVQENTGVDPAIDVESGDGVTGAYWLLIAKHGDDGPPGPQGETGPQGVSGTAVSTAGMVAFNVDENGHLWVSYTGDEAPNYYIGSDGHLYLDVTI